jgi:polysaccharide export outer membrane protein
MIRTLLFIFAGFWCCAGLAQNEVQTNQPADSGQPVFSTTLAQQAVATNAEAIPAPVATNLDSGGDVTADVTSTLDNQHILQPGDQVSFRIEEDRDPPGTPERLLLVSDSGDIDVPYIGTVNVSKKTCFQAAMEIKKLLEKDYYYKATVVIGLASAGKNIGHVYIWGEVKVQGALELPANETMTVGKAILHAGGFGDFAKRTKVKLIRTVNGERKTYVLNMEDILEKGQTEKDMTLEPDDYILVDKRAVNF